MLENFLNFGMWIFVSLIFFAQKRCVIIPKSRSKVRIEENMNIFLFLNIFRRHEVSFVVRKIKYERYALGLMALMHEILIFLRSVI